MRTPFLILFFILIDISLSGQSRRFTETISLGTVAGSEVELRIRKPKDACNQNHTFRYTVKVSNKILYNYYANFLIQYEQCNGIVTARWYSVQLNKCDPKIFYDPQDNEINARRLGDPWLIESHIENSPRFGKVDIGPPSIEPDKIIGTSNIFRGDKVRLTVDGGYLGRGDEWHWYQDICGKNFLGKGSSVQVSPLSNTTYYVRAEGNDGPTTNCISKDIKVSQLSREPRSIEASSSGGCYGKQVSLTVRGGSLGYDAQWVWYEGNCGGSRKIGEGERITVTVTEEDKIYYVRAEGPYNKTKCVNTILYGGPKAVLKGTISTIPIFCAGNKVNLEFKDIKEINGEIKWYKNYCGVNYIGTGPRIEIQPNQTTTYYARAETKCDKSECIPIVVDVYESTKKPFYIVEEPESKSGRKVKLRIGPGAKKSKDTDWMWYEIRQNSKQKYLGKGDSIEYRVKNNRNISLRAIGPCDDGEMEYESLSFDVNSKRKWSFTNNYSDLPNKLMHWGLRVGLGTHNVTRISRHEDLRQGSQGPFQKDQPISSVGVFSNIKFYPVNRNHYGIGIQILGYAGISPRSIVSPFLSSNNQTDINEKLEYGFWQAGFETFFGTSNVKLLASYDLGKEYIDYSRKENLNRQLQTNTNYDSSSINQTLGIGFRIGKVTNMVKKHPLLLDVQLTLANQIQNWDNTVLNNLGFFNLSNWMPGISIRLEQMNKFILGSQITLNTRSNEISSLSSLNWSNPNIKIYFGFSIDKFY